jgi:hypothetical protein
MNGEEGNEDLSSTPYRMQYGGDVNDLVIEQGLIRGARVSESKGTHKVVEE